VGQGQLIRQQDKAWFSSVNRCRNGDCHTMVCIEEITESVSGINVL
jgi:hypothetical protein